MKLLVSMGMRSAAGAPLRGRLATLDLARGAIVAELPVEMDPAHVPGPGAHQELTCAAWGPDGLLLQPGHTELLWIDPSGGRVVRRVSHPLFHNLHSASPGPAGTIALTAAGTESVLEVDAAGAVVRHHWLREGAFSAAYPGITDFRRVDHDALKPHSHHPNHAAWVGPDLWVTCFETRECRSLTRPRRIELSEGIPHDGRLRQGLLWFTLVTGQVIAVDPVTLERRLTLDLVALSGMRKRLGWCRGVEVVGSRLFVGFTMLRSTRHREVLRQLLWGEGGEKLPTRVVEVDLDRPRIVAEHEVGNSHGGTIYGLLTSEPAG